MRISANKIIAAFPLLLIFCTSHPWEGSDANQTELFEKRARSYHFEDSCVNLYRTILLNMDTLKAIDSISSIISSDSSVDWATKDSNSIFIHYNSGLYSGIVFRYENVDSSDTIINNPTGIYKTVQDNIVNTMPSSPKVIIVSPYYSFDGALAYYAKKCSLSLYNVHVTAKYDPPIILKNENVTLGNLKLLGEYGIIILSGHTGEIYGLNYTIKQSIFWTGEKFVEKSQTDNAYWLETFNTLDDPSFIIPIFAGIDEPRNGRYYAVGAPFFTKRKVFFGKYCIIWSGCCYSSISPWPEILGSELCGTYLGYKYEIGITIDAMQRNDFIKVLLDGIESTEFSALQKSCYDWYASSLLNPSTYGLEYFGNRKLCLWLKEKWTLTGTGFLETGTASMDFIKTVDGKISLRNINIFDPTKYNVNITETFASVTGTKIAISIKGIASYSTSTTFTVSMIGSCSNGIGNGSFTIDFTDDNNWNDDSGIWNGIRTAGNGITQ